ncbi:MAG: class I SAM-dependent methyltransferase [Micromonosporaceae bacterium]
MSTSPEPGSAPRPDSDPPPDRTEAPSGAAGDRSDQIGPPGGRDGRVGPAGAQPGQAGVPTGAEASPGPAASAEPAGRPDPVAAQLADLADRLSAVESRLSELADSVRRSVDRMLQAFRQSQPREVEALLQLYRDHLPRAPMPPSGQWALDPSGLLELLSRVPRDRPSLVLELGSGTSTVWLAYALERSGGRLVSVDHDPGYGQRTRDLLERHELSKVAEVRDAPLREVTVGGQERRWYDPTAFADVAGVDLLFIDGPPGATGPLARYPALPLLLPRLAPEALVVLDDAHRPDEQETVRRWLAEVDGLSPVPATVGTVAVLRYRAPTGRDDTDIAL